MKKYLTIIIISFLSIFSIINLASASLRVLTVPQGGTGNDDFEVNSLLIGNGSNSISTTTSPTLSGLQVNGNSTTTNSSYLGTTTGLNGIYINNWSDISSIIGGWATTSEQYFWNNTTTWAGFQQNFDNYYNATTTLNGFDKSLYFLVADFLSNWNSLYNATNTKSNLTISHDLMVRGTSTLATTTLAYTSKIGQTDNYLEIVQDDLKAGGTVGYFPTFKFTNNSSLYPTNFGSIYGGLSVVVDDRYPDTNPHIYFSSNNISEIGAGAVAFIDYSTSSDQLNFGGADVYDFSNQVAIGSGGTNGNDILTVHGNSYLDGNATTTGHLAALGGNSDQWNTAFANIWTTSSEQNFWNTTSTWTAFDTNFARNYNATTTFASSLDIHGN
ncbi:MAG: hypothetical protein WC917_00735, partial [Bacilli bacterium]